MNGVEYMSVSKNDEAQFFFYHVVLIRQRRLERKEREWLWWASRDAGSSETTRVVNSGIV